jgi:hypothetical protein
VVQKQYIIMNDFFESKFMQDLEDGKLPTIEIALSVVTIRNIAIAFLIVAVLVIMINYTFKKVV